MKSVFLILLLVTLVCGQHTTSPRFSPVPSASGIACIQKVCPSDSLQPSCPSDCSSGCKYIPDQCCPQLTVAVCQEGGASSSLSSLSASTASLSTPSPTLPSSSSPSSSSSVTSNTSSPIASPTPNSSSRVQSSLYYLSGLVILIGYWLL
ncbi:hypothetical protein [Absidia glauca]|uniref:WAP domain-containing protein n=1 Tax=Absidia glauca TaxID=4829 RepID=A0A168MD26_ABSGL|nr:hypothetical protein [Absidia glauca]